MADPRDKKRESAEMLLEAGAAIAGGAAGGAIGFFAGGPVGAVAGGGAGPLISGTVLHLANEVRARFLGPREEVRIGAALAFASEKIRQNFEDGQQVRRDGFFAEQPGERAAAEEVFEGVLLAAQREPQEKKMRFYGNLLANLAFHEEVGREQANLLVRLAQDLSYQQLCALAVLVGKDHCDSKLRQGHYLGGSPGWELLALLQEVYDLYRRGLLSPGPALPSGMLLGAMGINPDDMAADSLGVLLHGLMDLEDVPPEDLTRVAALLS